MRTLLHPDYWVEVPAGEYLTGLSDEQRELVLYQAYGRITYNYAKDRLRLIPDQSSVWLERFYIARFPITHFQYGTFEYEGTPPGNLPGLFEQSPSPMAREVAPVLTEDALRFCETLGGRLPTGYEWEKAGRGTDGRLYPWGNRWDFEAGYFFYGQYSFTSKRAAMFPRGVSPYGVWDVVGGLPEMVSMGGGGKMGCHARESSPPQAWVDHLLAAPSQGNWVSLRPVLDEWPKQQWPGFQAGLAEPNAEALQKMGPLADLLLTQYRWSELETKTLDRLEPAIVALREGGKEESQALLAEILHNHPDDEVAWLLQAASLPDKLQQRECVQQALSLRPDSEVAQKMQEMLEDFAPRSVDGKEVENLPNTDQ